jgi:sigma-B regulation protein RsbU (phosphoserine phosphatase)
VAQPSADRLALLYRISQTFNSSLDLSEVLNRVMDEVIATTHAERGFLMLHEEGDQGDQLAFYAARGMDQTTIEAPAFQISRGVVEWVAHEGQPRLTSDAQSDAWLSERASVMNLSLRSILCVPLQLKGKTLGVIYVDNRLHAGIFRPDDLELLSAIASSAAIAIENARLYQVAVEKGRIERELQLARQVQSSLLPRQAPRPAGWDLAARWQPARVVAGDFYDFIPLDERRLGLVIADVSDKGMPAALFMALSRSIIRGSVAQAPSPADSIAQANRLICADSSESMFVTVFYAQLDLAGGECVYVNAGHNPPLFYRARQDEFVELARTGMLLGVEETAPFKQSAIHLEPGDFVFLYTDGVTEAANTQNEQFGLDRMERVLQDNKRAPASDIIAALDRALSAFLGSTVPFDDITVLVARRLGSGG